jgi:hypothetical protein
MFETVLYSIVILGGLFVLLVSAGKLLAARDAKGRKRAMLSSLGAIVMIAIAVCSIYLCLYKILPSLAVLPISGIALALNYLVLGKYSRPVS